MSQKNAIVLHRVVSTVALPAYVAGTLEQPLLSTNGLLLTGISSGAQIADVLPIAALLDNLEQNALVTAAFNYGFDGLNWDRLRAFGDNADGVAPITLGALVALSRNTMWDGLQFWNRMRSASGITQRTLDSNSSLRIDDTGNWSIHNEPAVNVAATVTRAAAGIGVSNVAVRISATMNAVAAIAGPISLYLRDGAAGVGVIVKSWRFAGLAAGAQVIVQSDSRFVGSANTAMTLEWSAAPGATNFQNVTLEGHQAG